MSFDPFHEQQPQRDPVPRPPLEPAAPTGPAPNAAGGPPATPVRERLIFPAILLIIVGVLNLLYGGYLVISTLYQLSLSPEQIRESATLQREMVVKAFPGLKEVFEARDKEGITPEEEAKKVMPFMIGLTVAGVLGALLPLIAGIRMLQLRNYGLVFFGAVVAAVPCVSGSGCCCLGELAGIYAIVMLLQTDIRDAFR